jgi:hypothetical protein
MGANSQARVANQYSRNSIFPMCAGLNAAHAG